MARREVGTSHLCGGRAPTEQEYDEDPSRDFSALTTMSGMAFIPFLPAKVQNPHGLLASLFWGPQDQEGRGRALEAGFCPVVLTYCSWVWGEGP